MKLKHTAILAVLAIAGSAVSYASAALTFVSETPAISAAGQEFQILGRVVNETDSEIEGFTLTLAVDGQEFTKEYLTRILAPGASADVTWRTDYTPGQGTDSFDYTIRLDSPSADSSEVQGTAYVRARRWVVEERTGTWCAACPWGIYVFERMSEKMGDEFIGIALHTYGNDPMGTPEWQLSAFTTDETAPYTLINRTHGCHPRDLEQELEKMSRRVLRGSVEEASCSLDSDSRRLSVDTRVMFDSDYDSSSSDLRIGYYIIENDVNVDSHEYAQKNGFSGTGQVPGWGDKPALIDGKDMWHQHVGRGFSQDVRGVPGSVPAEVKGGQVYGFSHTFALPDNILNVKNCRLVIMLLDARSGNVLNGLELPLDGAYTDVRTPGADENAAPVYYDLMGRRVSNGNICPGIYIEVKGDNVRKVTVN